jgi:hypothetical protein
MPIPLPKSSGIYLEEKKQVTIKAMIEFRIKQVNRITSFVEVIFI